MEKQIRAQIDEANYCDIDSDCIITQFGCPFGCYSLVNKEAVFSGIREDVKTYGEKCAICKYKCAATPTQREIVCENKKCVVSKAEEEYDEFIFIQDVEGDVRDTLFHPDTGEYEADFQFDVTNIRLAHNQKDLFVLIGFANNLDYYFENNKIRSHVIGTLFLDTDNSAETGGKVALFNFGGFESRVDVWSGVKAIGWSYVSGNGQLKDLPEDVELEYFIEYHASKYDLENNLISINFDTTVKSDELPDRISYNENMLEIKIPFQDLDIDTSKSKTIRVLFEEAGAKRNQFSEEVIGKIE